MSVSNISIFFQLHFSWTTSLEVWPSVSWGRQYNLPTLGDKKFVRVQKLHWTQSDRRRQHHSFYWFSLYEYTGSEVALVGHGVLLTLAWFALPSTSWSCGQYQFEEAEFRISVWFASAYRQHSLVACVVRACALLAIDLHVYHEISA